MSTNHSAFIGIYQFNGNITQVISTGKCDTLAEENQLFLLFSAKVRGSFRSTVYKFDFTFDSTNESTSSTSRLPKDNITL